MMPKCILVVDDETDVLRTVGFRLESAGYEVLVAEDGQAGLDQIEKRRPDLILLDLRLPILDGAQVCQLLKATPKWKSIPIILFTASSQMMREESYKDLGADDCVTKPFEWEILLKKIQQHLEA